MYPAWPPRYGGPSAPPTPAGPPPGPAFQSFRDQHLAQLEQLQRMHQRQLESVLPAGPPPRHYYRPPAAYPYPPPPPYGHSVPPPDYQQPAAPPPPPEPEQQQPPPPPAPEQPPLPPPVPGTEGNPGEQKNLEDQQQFYYQQHLLSLQQKAKKAAKEMMAPDAESPQGGAHPSAAYAPPPSPQGGAHPSASYAPPPSPQGGAHPSAAYAPPPAHLEPPPLDEVPPPAQDAAPSMNLTEDPEQAQRLKTLQEAAAHWQQHEQHRLGFQYQGIIQKHGTLQQLLQRYQQLLAEPPHLAAMTVEVQLQHHEMQQKQFLPLHQEWESQFKKWQELLQTYAHKDQLQDYHMQWTSWQAHMKATKSQLKDKVTSLKGLKQQYGGSHYLAVVPPQYPAYSAVMPPAVPPAVPPGINIPSLFSAPGPPMYSTVPPPPLPTAPAFSEAAPPLPPVSAPPLPPAPSAPPPPPPGNTASMEAVQPPLPPDNMSAAEVPPLPEMTGSTVGHLPPPGADSSAHTPVKVETPEDKAPPSGLSYQAQQALKNAKSSSFAALANNSTSFPAQKPIAHVSSSQSAENRPDPKDDAKPSIFPSSPSRRTEKETAPSVPHTSLPMTMAGPRFPIPGFETPRFSAPQGGRFSGPRGPLGFRDARPLLGGQRFQGQSFTSATDAFQAQKPASTPEQHAECAPDPGDGDGPVQSSEPALPIPTPHKQTWERGQREPDKWDKGQGGLTGKTWDEQRHVSANRWDQPEEPQTWDRPTESSWGKTARDKWDVKDNCFSAGSSRSQENVDVMESPEGIGDTPARQGLERADAFPRDMREKHETSQPDRPDSQRDDMGNKWGDPQGYGWSASDSPRDSWFGPNRDRWSITENTPDLYSDDGATRNSEGPPLDKFTPFHGPNRFRFGAPEMPPRGRARFPGEPQRSRFIGPAGFSQRFSSSEGLPRDRLGGAEVGHRDQFSSPDDQPKHLYEGTSFPTPRNRFGGPSLPPDRFRGLEARPTIGQFESDSTSRVKWGFSEERERFDVNSSQDGWAGKRAPYKGSDRPEWQSKDEMAEVRPPLPVSDHADKEVHVDERWNRQVDRDAMGGGQWGTFGFAPEDQQSSQSLPLDNRVGKETPLDVKIKADEQNTPTTLPAPFLSPFTVGSQVLSADSEITDLRAGMENCEKTLKDRSLNKEIISAVPAASQVARPASPVGQKAAETTNSSLHKTKTFPTMQSAQSSEKSLPGPDTKMDPVSDATMKNAVKLSALQESPATHSPKEPASSNSRVPSLEAAIPNAPRVLITNPTSLANPDGTQMSPDNCSGPPAPARSVPQKPFSSQSAASPAPSIRPGAPHVVTPVTFGAQVVPSVRPIAPQTTLPFRPGLPQTAVPVRSGALRGPPPIRPLVPRASPPVRTGVPRPPPPARPSFPWASPSIRQGIPHVGPGQVRAARPVRLGAPRMPPPVRPVTFHPPVSDDFSSDVPPDEDSVYEQPIDVDPRAQFFYKGADLGKSETEPEMPSDREHFLERKPFTRMPGPEGHRGYVRQRFTNAEMDNAESHLHPEEARPSNYRDYELSSEPQYYASDFSLEGPRRGNSDPKYINSSRGRSKGFIRDRLPPRPGSRDVMDFPIERDFEPRDPFLGDKVQFREGPDNMPPFDREKFRGEPMLFERERYLDPLLNDGRRDPPGEELRSENWERDRYWRDGEPEYSRDPYFRDDRLPVPVPPLPRDVRCDPWLRESSSDREGYYERSERRYLLDDDEDDVEDDVEDFPRIPVDPDVPHRERDWLPSRRSISPHRPFSPVQPRSSLPPLPPLDNYREERWRLDRDFHERKELRIREYSEVPLWRKDRKCNEFQERPNPEPRDKQWFPSDRAMSEGLNVLPTQSTGPDSEPAGHGVVALSQRQHEIILKAAQELKMLREQKEQLDNLKNFFSSSNPSDALKPVPAPQPEVLQMPPGSLDEVEGASTSMLASSVRGAAEHWDEDSFSGLWDEERQAGQSANLPVGSKLPGIQQTVDYAHGRDLTVGKVEQMPYGERVVLPEPALERGSSSFPTDYLIDCYDRDLRDRDPYFERQGNKHLDRRGYERERERDRDRLDSHRDRGDHDRERFDRHSREERSSSYRDKETTNRRSASDKPSYERKPERSSFEAAPPAFGATRRPYPEERPVLPPPVPVPPPEKKPETKNVDDLLKKPGRGNRPDRIVVIMRGLPGSGKTHVAKLIRDKEVEYGGSAPRVLSLDDYFMTEVEKVEKDPESGKKVIKKVMEYEYEPEMEESYRCGMLKTFKKTLDDGFFPFIILDSIHDRVRHFEQFWSAAKTKGFEVYLAEISADSQTCAKRNVHGRKLKDLSKMADCWEAAPRHMIRLDIRSLLQDAAIEEVEMEDSEPSADQEQEVKKELEEEESERGYLPKSKWEMDTSEAKLDKLDGLKTRKRDWQSMAGCMEDYLQLPDDYDSRESAPGKKRVRWADLEEKKDADRKRAIGFIVGQTDWEKITDKSGHLAERALNRTKYI